MKNTFLALSLLILASLSCSGYWEATTPKTPIPATFQPQISTQDEYAAIIPATGDYMVCNTETGLNVRGRPEDTGRILYVLEPGTPVNIREWSKTGNGWAMIAPANWVNADYLCQWKP